MTEELKQETTGQEYDASQIQVLEGLEAVRMRPGMYIGSTSKEGLHHLVWEIVDNAVDEALSGFGSQIDVTINKDGSLSVADQGRGMPTGMHAMGKPTVEVIFTVLHAGGKFDKGAYKISGGLHGVGASVVNALSTWLEVTVYKNGKIHFIRFEKGVPQGDLQILGETDKTGTSVTFMPDGTIFETLEFNETSETARMKQAAYLTPGVSFTFKNLKT